MKDYRIVRGDVGEVAKKVRELIKEGWQPLAGPIPLTAREHNDCGQVTFYDRIAQAMVKL